MALYKASKGAMTCRIPERNVKAYIRLGYQIKEIKPLEPAEIDALSDIKELEAEKNEE